MSVYAEFLASKGTRAEPVGIELKGTYFAAAVRNLMRCEKNMAEGTLFEGSAA